MTKGPDLCQKLSRHNNKAQNISLHTSRNGISCGISGSRCFRLLVVASAPEGYRTPLKGAEHEFHNDEKLLSRAFAFVFVGRDRSWTRQSVIRFRMSCTKSVSDMSSALDARKLQSIGVSPRQWQTLILSIWGTSWLRGYCGWINR